MKTEFTSMVGVTHPLVGFNRTPAVVAEVSRAGGLGVLAATAYSPEELDAQLTWIEQETGGRPYGVDLLLPAEGSSLAYGSVVSQSRDQIPESHMRFVRRLLENYGIRADGLGSGSSAGDAIVTGISAEGAERLLDVAFSHRIALVASALGPPPPHLVEQAKQSGVVVGALVGKKEHALKQLERGVDLLVAQGTEAGGHTGTVATMVLTPEIVDIAGDVPVLCAGGIASGRQMAAAMALGAAGVWCGSVWLRSREDMAPMVIKEKFLAASSDETVRSATRTGKPARQLRSPWHDEWEKPDSPPILAMPAQVALAKEAWSLIDRAAVQGSEGARELASFYVGQVVGQFGVLQPAGDIVEELVASCQQCFSRLVQLLDD